MCNVDDYWGVRVLFRGSVYNARCLTYSEYGISCALALKPVWPSQLKRTEESGKNINRTETEHNATLKLTGDTKGHLMER